MKKAIFLLLLLPLGVFAQRQVHVLSMDEAVKKAITFRAEVKNASLDYEIAKKKVKETLGIGLPQINGSGEMKYNYELPTSLLPGQIFGRPPGTYVEVQFGVPWNVTLNITATQLIFNGNYFVGIQASKAFKDLMSLNLKHSENQIKQKVYKAYYSVLIAEERAKLLDANIEKVENLLATTEALNKEGFAQSIDVDRLKVLHNNLKSEKENLQRFIQLTYALFKFQVGINLQDSVILTDTLPKIDLAEIEKSIAEEGSFEEIYKRRMEISMLEQQLRLRQLNIKKERVGYLPSLAGFGMIAAQAQRLEFADIFDTKQRWFPIGSVGLRLQVPIFDGLQRNFRIQQNKLEYIKTENTLRETKQAIHLQVQQTRTQLMNQLNSVETQKANMELAKRILEQARKKYETGLGSNIEVIQAETSYKEARVNYFNALLEAYNLFVDYKYSIGKL